MTSKKTKISAAFIAVALIAVLFVPALLLADNATTTRNAKEAKKFCSRASETLINIEEKIADNAAKIEAKRIEALNNLERRRNERDARIDEGRAKAGDIRTEQFAKLEKLAKTDVQKQALTAFKEAVKNAIASRPAAIDAAIETFRQGTSQALTERKTAVDAAVAAYRNAVKTALEKAQSDCTKGVSAATIHKNLRTALKTAKEKFTSDKQAIEKLAVDKKVLIENRKQAIEKAIQDFKTAMEKAKADFKTAFGTK